MVSVITIQNGSFRQNAYVVLGAFDTAIIVDPGGETSRFFDVLEEKNANLTAIFLTHGHFDHIGAAQDLVDAFNVACYLHSADHALAKRASLYSMALGATRDVKRRPLQTMLPLESLNNPHIFGSLDVSWKPTPGHTDGSVCILVGDHVFTGDTLLPEHHMTKKLPGADGTALARSIGEMRSWEPSLVAHPGHGPSRRFGELMQLYGGV